MDFENFIFQKFPFFKVSFKYPLCFQHIVYKRVCLLFFLSYQSTRLHFTLCKQCFQFSSHQKQNLRKKIFNKLGMMVELFTDLVSLVKQIKGTISRKFLLAEKMPLSRLISASQVKNLTIYKKQKNSFLSDIWSLKIAYRSKKWIQKVLPNGNLALKITYQT